MVNHLLHRMKTRHRLAGELSIVLMVKLVLLIAAGFFLFGANQHIYIDAHIIAAHLFEASKPVSK